ncbi:hypothetical protein [Catellatospora sp. NPDC049609]|uniref:TolB family protein n=1 Tax=Catellatospora sp. NPDC049609 TaxID=3155505 RepID=UPI00343F05D3
MSSSGIEGNNDSHPADVSGDDGRFIVFASTAANLTSPTPPAGSSQIYLRDRVAGTTQLISRGTDGKPAQGSSGSPSISADGSVIAFVSSSSSLVRGDTNGKDDIFIYTPGSQSIQRILTNAFAQPNGHSSSPEVSGDGRMIAYATGASNHTPDVNGTSDIFVYDRVQAVNKLVSRQPNGAVGNSGSTEPTINSDGTKIAFRSDASNLANNDTNGQPDVFLTTFTTPSTAAVTRVSVKVGGGEANGLSGDPAISANGNFVAFASQATNLVTGDTNNKVDVFRKDVVSGAVVRHSVGLNGVQGNGPSFEPSISADGSKIVFTSHATNLVGDDENAGIGDVFLSETSRSFIVGRVLVSRANTQGSANGQSFGGSMNADGSVISFTSRASNLVAGQSSDSGALDVFTRTRNN